MWLSFSTARCTGSKAFANLSYNFCCIIMLTPTLFPRLHNDVTKIDFIIIDQSALAFSFMHFLNKFIAFPCLIAWRSPLIHKGCIFLINHKNCLSIKNNNSFKVSITMSTLHTTAESLSAIMLNLWHALAVLLLSNNPRSKN